MQQFHAHRFFRQLRAHKKGAVRYAHARARTPCVCACPCPVTGMTDRMTRGRGGAHAGAWRALGAALCRYVELEAEKGVPLLSLLMVMPRYLYPEYISRAFSDLASRLVPSGNRT